MRNRSKTRTTKSSGFTLIELVVTMVVAAILVAIAISSYTSQTRKSRRTDAKQTLLDLAAREQSLYSTTTAYSNIPTAVGYPGTAAVSTGSGAYITNGNGYYQISIDLTAAVGPTVTATGITSTGTPAGFLLTANATGSQVNDVACTKLTVDNLGNQIGYNSSGAVNTATCWSQ
jgi:type IV pilus assembly protein PilE